MKKIIMIAGGALLLVGVSVGATIFLMPKPQPLPVEGGPTYPDGEPIETAELPVVDPLKLFYYNVHPEFVINLPGASKPKYLMLEMTIATTDEKANAAIDDHIPELRNDLLMMMSEQKGSELLTTEGKDNLRKKTYDIVEKVVAKHYGPGRVADIFYSRFVLQ